MPSTVVQAVVAAVRAGAAAVIPVLPVVDTLKSVNAAGEITATVDRDRLVVVQTPQGFRGDVLTRAHDQAEHTGTDDAALVEALGLPVTTVPGDRAGFKITTAYDLWLAELILRDRS